MVYVQGGKYEMGDASDADNPPHTVVVDSFRIAKYEVTIETWMEYLSNSGVYFEWDNYYWGPMEERVVNRTAPVLYVTWWHALDFCNWLSRKHGLVEAYAFTNRPTSWGKEAYGPNDWNVQWLKDANGFRLPTEAEWEYAARGGVLTKGHTYSGANDPETVGWWIDNSNGRAQPVGTRLPNELGIFDMSGNADEWCWDLYGISYYENSPETNPAGPDRASTEQEVYKSTGNERVTRGEGAFGPPVSVFHRSYFLPHGTEFVTVRPVRNAE